MGKRMNQTCKCSRNGKRVACGTLKLVPKTSSLNLNFKIPPLKIPDFLNFTKKSVYHKKRRHHIGGSRKIKKRSSNSRGFFFSAACKKNGNTIKCDNMFGW